MKVNINPVWLDSFIQLVKTKSFTKAAESLHMTQPGVSQHIKKLELFFGAELIARNAKGFSITSLGTELYEYGQLRNKFESEFVHRLRNTSVEAPQIKILVDSVLYPVFFAHHLALYSIENQKRVKISSGSAGAVTEAMVMGDCDAAFVLSSLTLDVAGATCVGNVEFGLVCKKGNFPSSGVSLDALNQRCIVTYPEMEHEWLLEPFLSETSPVSLVLHYSKAETMSAALYATSLADGFTLIPRFHFDTYDGRHKLDFFPLEKTKKLYFLQKSSQPKWADAVKKEDRLTSIILKDIDQSTHVYRQDSIMQLNLSILALRTIELFDRLHFDGDFIQQAERR